MAVFEGRAERSAEAVKPRSGPRTSEDSKRPNIVVSSYYYGFTTAPSINSCIMDRRVIKLESFASVNA